MSRTHFLTLLLGTALGGAATLVLLRSPGQEGGQVVWPSGNLSNAGVSLIAKVGDRENAPGTPPEDPWTEPEAVWNDVEDQSASLDALHTENLALRKQVDDLLQWIMQNLPASKLADLPRQQDLTGPVLGQDATLTDAMADALHLSPSERQTLDDGFRAAREGIEGIRTNRMQVRQRGDDRIYLRIPAFPDEGQKFEAAMTSVLKQQLGEERYATFMDRAGDELERQYYYFGAARQTITFRTFTSDETGEPMIRISDRLHISRGEGRRTIEETSGTYTSVPPSYQAYIDWDVSPSTP